MTRTSDNRKKIGVLAATLVALILICVVVSVITSQLMMGNQQWRQHDLEHGHKWLHQALDLTETESAAIDAFEPDYRTQRASLLGAFNSKIEDLRQQLVTSEQFTPEVEHAIHELHIIHGQLQELSIRHYFQMMKVLPPEKQLQLKALAGQALSVPE